MREVNALLRLEDVEKANCLETSGLRVEVSAICARPPTFSAVEKACWSRG